MAVGPVHFRVTWCYGLKVMSLLLSLVFFTPLSLDHSLSMHVFSAWTLESFASRVVAKNAACVAGDARP